MQEVKLEVPRLLGEVVRPSDSSYESFCHIINTRFTNRPSLILRCAGVADVRAAVNYARESGLPVAVRSAGNSLMGTSATDGGIVIDLGLMRDVDVDLVRRTVRIRPGADGTDVLTETTPFGLAPVGAADPGVAYGGLASLSGHNVLSYRHGYACDDVLSMDVVLADGSFVTASANSNEDLFWAMRGAGDNFGIVTSYELPLHPIPAEMHAGSIEWALEDAAAVFAGVGAINDTLSEDMWWCCMTCGDLEGEVKAMLFYQHLGTRAEAERDVAALASIAPPLSQNEQALTYFDYYAQLVNEGFAIRIHNSGCDLRAVDEATAELLAERARGLAELPIEQRMISAFYFFRPGLGCARRPTTPSAFNRYDGVIFLAQAYGAEDEKQESWADATTRAVVDAGLSIDGFNVTIPSWLSYRADEPTARAIYGADGYARLRRLKALYDPSEMFVGCADIKPVHDDEFAGAKA